MKEGSRPRGRPRLRYKDTLKRRLGLAGISHQQMETLASDRAGWRVVVRKSAEAVHTQWEVREDIWTECPSGSWTDWFDRDDPTGTVDNEILTDLRQDYPGQICVTPTAVHARVISTQQEASLTGQHKRSAFAARMLERKPPDPPHEPDPVTAMFIQTEVLLGVNVLQAD
ncbi:hypothetical protein Bbelb_292490 [Branchiostoma belcheri]|nr:hypothetical protein Bbelb_292490 [Branchiostoma belcheri]